MLSAALKKHKAEKIAWRNEQEATKAKTLSLLYSFNAAALNCVNTGVASVYNNQVQIDAEMKEMQNRIETMNSLTQRWAAMMDKFNNSLKELGDVENWAQSIESDLTTVTTCLEHVQKKN